MWIPETEEQIRRAIANGTLTESGTFDAKAELPRPGRNKDLAKDITAMTPDGGVLLYGIGGDDPTRPDTLLPFDLAGAAERIDQVAQTCISEPPAIDIRDVASDDSPGLGYLVVVVPASPRAPHMLTIGGDNRYWGRGAATNRLLTEGEVARLYARRERWEVNREGLLRQAVEAMPFSYEDPLEDIGPMVVVVKPVLNVPGLVSRAAGEMHITEFLRRELIGFALKADPYPGQGSTGLGGAYALQPQGADAWILSSERQPTIPYQARLEIEQGGAARYWHSPTIHRRNREGASQSPILMEQSVTRAVHQHLATMAWLCHRAGYAGMIDVGAAVLNIEHAISATLSGGFDRGPAYGAKSYERHARITSNQLINDVPAVVRLLLVPLYQAISVRDYDPYDSASDQMADPRQAS